jgi:hypothetical protein
VPVSFSVDEDQMAFDNVGAFSIKGFRRLG